MNLPTAYLFATGLGGIVWVACYALRPDMRRVMIGMSIVGLPLALSDNFYVPSYWRPETIGHIPVGIEGFVFSFEAAGICAVIYAVVSKKRFALSSPGKKGTPYALKCIPVLLPPMIAASVAAGVQTNVEWGLYAGLIAGTVAAIAIRRDLFEASLKAGIAFLPIYTSALVVWVAVYPEVHAWFTLQHMPRWYFVGVPLTEIVFGALFAAYWTCLYPLAFDQRYQ